MFESLHPNMRVTLGRQAEKIKRLVTKTKQTSIISKIKSRLIDQKIDPVKVTIEKRKYHISKPCAIFGAAAAPITPVQTETIRGIIDLRNELWARGDIAKP